MRHTVSIFTLTVFTVVALSPAATAAESDFLVSLNDCQASLPAASEFLAPVAVESPHDGSWNPTTCHGGALRHI